MSTLRLAGQTEMDLKRGVGFLKGLWEPGKILLESTYKTEILYRYLKVSSIS